MTSASWCYFRLSSPVGQEIAREVAVQGVANAADAAFRSLGLVAEVPSLGGAVPLVICVVGVD